LILIASKTFSLFPNPSATNLIIDLSSLKGSDVQVSVFDILGNEMISFNKVNCIIKYFNDISNLAVGNYVLNIISDEGLISKKFIKN
jgi:hypothetical protein